MKRNFLPIVVLTLTAASALPVVAGPIIQRHEEYLKLDPAEWSATNATNNEFGAQVAIDGDTMVVSSANMPAARKEVFVYERRFLSNVPGQQSAHWDLVAKLEPADAGNTWREGFPSSDKFGSALAVSGDTIVIGDYGDYADSTGVDAEPVEAVVPNTDNGAVHVYRKVDGEWGLESYIKVHEFGRGPIQFGYSVAIEGNRMLVGAPVDRTELTTEGLPASTSTTGCAYLYERRSTIGGERWVRVYDFDFNKYTNNAGSNRRLCHSVALDGDRVAFGAPGADYTQAYEQGSAEIWEKDKIGDGWSIKALLHAPNRGYGDYFGGAVDLEGGWLVVGARSEDSGFENEGADPDLENDEDDGSGAVYVYERGAGGVWQFHKMFKSNDELSSIRFGQCVTIDDGRILATGIYGSSRLYSLGASGEWSLDRKVIRLGPNGGYDEFGYSSSLSGELMAMGCPKDSSYDPEDPTDDSAPFSGAVRTYHLEEAEVEFTKIELTESGRFAAYFTGNPGYENWGISRSTDGETWNAQSAFDLQELAPGSFVFLGITASESHPAMFYKILVDK